MVSKNGDLVIPFRCLTMAGTPCIQICVDNEKDNSVYGKQFWDLKKALVALVSKQKLHKFDKTKRSNPDILDDKGTALMVRVLKNNKYQSLKILLEDGEADPTFPAN